MKPKFAKVNKEQCEDIRRFLIHLMDFGYTFYGKNLDTAMHR